MSAPSFITITMGANEQEKKYSLELESATNDVEIRVAGSDGFIMDNFILERGNTDNYSLQPFELPCNPDCLDFARVSAFLAVLSVILFVLTCSYIKSRNELKMFDPN